MPRKDKSDPLYQLLRTARQTVAAAEAARIPEPPLPTYHPSTWESAGYLTLVHTAGEVTTVVGVYERLIHRQPAAERYLRRDPAEVSNQLNLPTLEVRDAHWLGADPTTRLFKVEGSTIPMPSAEAERANNRALLEHIVLVNHMRLNQRRRELMQNSRRRARSIAVAFGKTRAKRVRQEVDANHLFDELLKLV